AFDVINDTRSLFTRDLDLDFVGPQYSPNTAVEVLKRMVVDSSFTETCHERDFQRSKIEEASYIRHNLSFNRDGFTQSIPAQQMSPNQHARQADQLTM
ncbi:hypothetical protein M513_08410, partial [Trichuris suis]